MQNSIVRCKNKIAEELYDNEILLLISAYQMHRTPVFYIIVVDIVSLTPFSASVM